MDFGKSKSLQVIFKWEKDFYEIWRKDGAIFIVGVISRLDNTPIFGDRYYQINLVQNRQIWIKKYLHNIC